jgi:hypothetical protein
MARPKNALQVIEHTELDETRIQRAVAQRDADHEEVNRLALQFNYQGEMTVDAFEANLRIERRNFAFASLAIGANLLMLRAACPPDVYIERAERLGYGKAARSRFTTLATRFGDGSKLELVIEAAGTQSKLLELAILQDSELEALVEQGETTGIRLDEIDGMTAKQLREALRNKDAELVRSQEVRAKQEATVDKLKIELKGMNKLPADKKLGWMCEKVATVVREIEGMVAITLSNRMDEVHQYTLNHNLPAQDAALAGMLGQLDGAIARVRSTFNLPDVVPVEPEWKKGLEESQRAAFAEAAAKDAKARAAK